MDEGNGKRPYQGQSAAFESQFAAASEKYKAAGYVHDDGRDPVFKSMADVLRGPAPEMPWLVPDYVPLRNATLLTGDGGVGKSLLAMQLMCCVVTGRPFFGIPVTQGRACGLFCEDEQAVLHHRQLRMSEAMGIADHELEQFYFMDRAGQDSVMFGQMIEDQWSYDFTDFFYRVVKLLKAIKPVLLILDTAADIFGGNENNRPQVRAFVRQLRKLSYDYNCAVVLCAHPSLTGISSGSGYSGSTAWHNSVRSRLYLTKPDDAINEDDRILKGMKSNYGPTQQDLLIRYVNGAFERVERGGTVARIERSAKDRSIIDLVRVAAASGKHLSKQPQARDRYLPTVASRQIVGMSFGLARKIMTDLLIDGEIVESMTDKHLEKLGLVVPPVVPPVHL